MGLQAGPGVKTERDAEKTDEISPPKRIVPAAERALAEAAARRKKADEARAATPAPKEVHGRKGPEPIRYGDWEKNGLASDF